MTLEEESIVARKAWHGASHRKLADHIFIHRCETEREREVGPGYEPSKPPPSDGRLPARLHHLQVLNLPKQCHLQGTKCSNPEAYVGHSYFKPQWTS